MSFYDSYMRVEDGMLRITLPEITIVGDRNFEGDESQAVKDVVALTDYVVDALKIIYSGRKLKFITGTLNKIVDLKKLVNAIQADNNQLGPKTAEAVVEILGQWLGSEVGFHMGMVTGIEAATALFSSFAMSYEYYFPIIFIGAILGAVSLGYFGDQIGSTLANRAYKFLIPEFENESKKFDLKYQCYEKEGVLMVPASVIEVIPDRNFYFDGNDLPLWMIEDNLNQNTLPIEDKKPLLDLWNNLDEN